MAEEPQLYEDMEAFDSLREKNIFLLYPIMCYNEQYLSVKMKHLYVWREEKTGRVRVCLKMKKVMAVLLAFSACVALSACSAPGEKEEQTASRPSSEVITSAEAEEESSPASLPLEQAKMREEIVTVTAYDGLKFDGKLRLPEGDPVEKLVIYVNGSGPNTYDNKRQAGDITFHYHDLFAQQFTQEGIAYFSYNTRGVTVGQEAPYFADIAEDDYQTYLPENEVKDVEAIIRQLKADSRLQNAKVILLGWSEGTMIAPLVALGEEVPVDALFLAGYCNETMADILDWQLTGGSSMVTAGAYLDGDRDGNITKEEYDSDPYQVAAQLGTFEELDGNGDGQINREDFREMLKETHDETFRAFDGGDDEWLKENYGVRLTSAWFLAHRKLAPNRETLPKLTLPIYIFQGTIDANVPVEQSREIAETFRTLGKTNLHLQEFEMHDHDLNYISYPLYGTISEGLQAIFDAAKGL